VKISKFNVYSVLVLILYLVGLSILVFFSSDKVREGLMLVGLFLEGAMPTW
jgi:hypothetical protein